MTARLLLLRVEVVSDLPDNEVAEVVEALLAADAEGPTELLSGEVVDVSDVAVTSVAVATAADAHVLPTEEP